jgi:hypothetical protein
VPDHQRPLVSVIVPCYNYARYLPDCVASVMTQQGVDVEVLIIDDASSDDSADVARQLAHRYDRVEARTHASNAGHIATYNEGLTWARGDFTVLLSADDLLIAGALSRAVAVFAQHAEVGVVYGRAVRFVEGNGPPPRPSFRPGGRQVWSGRQWIESRCRLGWVGIVSPEVVVRTPLQREVGGYRANLPHSGDGEMWLRLASRAAVAYVDSDHAYYRVHAENMSKSFTSTLVDARHRKAAFDAVAGYWATFLPDATDLHRRALRGLASDLLWRACRAYDRGAVDSLQVEELTRAAIAVYPQATRLANYRRLATRIRLGRRLSRLATVIFMPDVVYHRIQYRRSTYGRLWWRPTH